jgi:hypothetical protein
LTQVAFNKYLLHYCEAPTKGFDSFPRKFEKALVVPTYREKPGCLSGLLQAFNGELLVLVINRPDNVEATAADFELLEAIEQQGALHWQHPEQKNLRLFELYERFILLLDHVRDGPPLPCKQGVGLARKLGMDLCCRLYQLNIISCQFVFNSDADAELPDDYFTASDTLSNSDAAAVLPYRHRATAETKDAILRYELRLRYYEQGLIAAGSPYAYQTIGSTQCINLLHYAMVRGFPKRSAGEDFYLLNKLAKTGAIRKLIAPAITVAARLSARTPFGTGTALQTLSEDADKAEFYHPEIFIELQRFLQALENYAQGDNAAIDEAFLRQIDGLADALSHARKHGRNPQQCLKHLHSWFDGFRTLKFIHKLRAESFPSISFETLQAARQKPRYRQLIPTVVADEYLLTVHTAPS